MARRGSNILGDFDTGEDDRQVQFPGEDAPRAITADDIAYVIGSGRYAQRYLYEVDRNEYMVLPVEWNVVANKWQPYVLAEEWPSEAYDWAQNCAYCHTTGFDVERGRWQDDGVQCESCHGPASSHIELAQDAGRRPSEEELTAVRAAIYRSPDPQTCGQCHSRGSSPDGHPYPVGYTPGASLSDFFTLVPNDAADHWWLAGHASQPNMQYNEWLESTHATSVEDMRGSDYAEDSCLACHSEDARMTTRLTGLVESEERDAPAPEAVTVASAQWGVTCTTCHQPHTDSEEPLDLVMEPNALCASCHTNPPDSTGVHHPVTEMFEGVTLVPGVEGVPGVHFSEEDGPRCLTCHMQSVPVSMSSAATEAHLEAEAGRKCSSCHNGGIPAGAASHAAHSFQPVLPGESQTLPSACEGCHNNLTTNDLSLLVSDTQAAVKARLEAARAQLASLTVPADGSEDAARYQQMVTALDFVANDGSFGIHNYRYTDALLKAAESDLSALGGVTASATPAPSATPPGGIVTISAETPAQTVDNGARPVTFVVIGFVIAVLLIAAFAFFRKSDG